MFLTLSVVNFVSGADTRGTMDILWSCLFTIIACTYTFLHLNVSEQRGHRDPGILGDIRWMVKRIWNSLTWMLITIVAPELLLGKYWADFWAAKTDLVKLKDFAAEDGVPWTMTHSLLANMGGFVISWDSRMEGHADLGESNTNTSSKCSVLHSMFQRTLLLFSESYK